MGAQSVLVGRPVPARCLPGAQCAPSWLDALGDTARAGGGAGLWRSGWVASRVPQRSFFARVSWWLPAMTASSALQEVALDGAPGSPECELILGGVGL